MIKYVKYVSTLKGLALVTESVREIKLCHQAAATSQNIAVPFSTMN